ncbi:nuclear transport factor 2 family protein [Mucilaginibacter koreensis]
MRILFILLIAIVISTGAYAQQNETAAIKQTIANLFDGMRRADTTLVRSAFAKGMVLHSVAARADGSVVLVNEKPDDFIKSIGTPHKEMYDERLGKMDIKIDADLASVWVPYQFYLGSKFSHCGVDVFQLMKIAAGWKIIYIADTRHKDGCVVE